MSNTTLHKKWWSMIARCDYPCSRSYKSYGGRGIAYDPKWRIFENFFQDMGPSYITGYSLDRIDPNGNYCKENCRWIPLNEQANTRRNCRFIEWNGKKMTCAQWGREIGMHRDTILYRLKNGWTPEMIFTIKPYTGNKPLPPKTSYKKACLKCSLCDAPYQSRGFCKIHYFRWYNKTIRKGRSA